MKPLSEVLSTSMEEVIVLVLSSWTSLAESNTLPFSDLLAELPKGKLIKLLSSTKQEIVEAVLCLLDKICYSSDPAVTTFMTDDVLSLLAKTLSEQRSASVLTIVSWIAFNFAIGPSSHAERLISLGVFEALCVLVINQSVDSSV